MSAAASMSAKEDSMATNLALDDSLIEEARIAGRHRTKKDAVTMADRKSVV